MSSIGCDIDSFWTRLIAGAAEVAEIPPRWRQFYKPASHTWSPLMEPNYAASGLSKTDRLLLSKAAQIGLLAARQAAAQAHWAQEATTAPAPRIAFYDRAGVFIGTGLGGAPAPLDNYAAHLLSGFRPQLSDHVQQHPDDTLAGALLTGLLNHPRVNPMVFCQTMPNALAAQISIQFGVRGSVDTTCAACTSGTIALGKAFRAIQRGELDVALAGGIEHLGDRAGGVFMGFDRLGALAKPYREIGSENRPFDADRSGFLFSEGGAAIAFLESETSLKSRGQRAIAEIIGYAESHDAHSIAAISEDQNAITPMLRKALLDANLEASDIDYINAHGTGTQLNDQIEARIIERMFGARPLINSTKSILGHTVGAAGAFEFIVAALSLQRQAVHPCLNLENPITDLNFSIAGGAATLQTALTQNFGFGGHNAALVLRRAEPL